MNVVGLLLSCVALTWAGSAYATDLVDTGARWSLVFSSAAAFDEAAAAANTRPPATAKTVATDIFFRPPHGLAAQAQPGAPQLMPGFAYAPKKKQAGEAEGPLGKGFGIGWFVQMGTGAGMQLAPMIRGSNATIAEDLETTGGALVPSTEGSRVLSGIRSHVIFAHVGEGGGLAHAPGSVRTRLLSCMCRCFRQLNMGWQTNSDDNCLAVGGPKSAALHHPAPAQGRTADGKRPSVAALRQTS
jgi:hypothetical protein